MPKIFPIDYRKLSKFFEYSGFKLIRQKGDHIIYEKEGVRRPVIIPRYKDIPVFIIKENLKTAGISREEYLKYFKSDTR